MKKEKMAKKILLTLLSILIMCILLNQEIFFYIIPNLFGTHPFFLNSGDNDDHNTGFIYPLNVVDPYDDSEYAFIYYDSSDMDPIFYVCDDSDFIKTHINGFIVYNSNEIYDRSTGGDFLLFKDGVCIDNNYTHSILIDTYWHTRYYNRPFKRHITEHPGDLMTIYEYCQKQNWDYEIHYD